MCNHVAAMATWADERILEREKNVSHLLPALVGYKDPTRR
jgi:hypothetical protein